MARHRWEHLPDDVRDVISAQAGSITSVQHVQAGSVADFTAVLSAGAGVFFCKGALLETKGAGFLRNEVRLNPHLPADLVPRLRWHLQAGGQLMAGFEYAPGRPADLRPGSKDLPLVADAVTRMAAALTPCPPVPIQPATARWGRLLDPAFVEGDTLLHTDMTHNNFPIDGDQVFVVDWSMPCRGAMWLDTARMVVRLIRAGHSAQQAQDWASTLSMWARCAASRRTGRRL